SIMGNVGKSYCTYLFLFLFHFPNNSLFPLFPIPSSSLVLPSQSRKTSSSVLLSLSDQNLHSSSLSFRIMELTCPCGNGYLIRKVTTKGPNMGRPYYKCPGFDKASLEIIFVHFYFMLYILTFII
ncbi:hypothetical protein KIW84_041820, partial [Lathyrus oleraceus]